MTSASSVIRSLLIYSVCLPLAIILGYLLANDWDITTVAIFGLMTFLLLMPLLLRWHHAWLIATWNMSMVFPFLPGHPDAWIVFAWLSLAFSVLGYILNRKHSFITPVSVAKPLLLLLAVVLITARCTGGIGMRSMGSDTFGGKRYFLMFSAIAGFFALTSQRVNPARAVLMTMLFFVGSATQAIGELAGYIGPGFNFLFTIFPVSGRGMAAIVGDPLMRVGALSRLGGLATASTAVFCAFLCRYGISDLFTWKRLGRLTIFTLFVLAGMMAGFRSMLITFLVTFAIVFYMEGLMRSRMLPVILLFVVLGGALVVSFSKELPLSMQRTLSFLPIEISPIAKMDAESSTEWRLQMWRHLLPQVPQYLILGKGLAFNPNDVVMAHMGVAMGRGSEKDTEGSEIVGDYHNGPLSVILPFGIFGVIAFVWFVAACIRVLIQNYQFGDPAFKIVNRFIFSFFIAKIIMFVMIFGSLYSDLATFTGLVGLSVAVNGGVAKPAVEPVPESKPAQFPARLRLAPPVRRPASAG
jgi:hypothetical protein